MRFKLFSVLAVLLLVGSNDARPPSIASPEVVEEESPVATGTKDDSSWQPVEPRSSPAVQSDSRQKSSNQHELKNLDSIDQSLRTVATQLLNVTTLDETTTGKFKPEIVEQELSPNVLLLRKPATVTSHVNADGNPQYFNGKLKTDVELVQQINSEISSLESMGIGFGRPTNSKFGYFESSHPGEAMAMTEEELERELMTSSTRLITAHKNLPTTTGGISTWVLLNSPTTTVRPLQDHNNKPTHNDDKQVNVQLQLETKFTTPVKIFETTVKTDTKPERPEDKTTVPATTTPMEKIIRTVMKSTTPIVKKSTVAIRQISTTTEKPEKTTQKTKTAPTLTSTPASINGGSMENDVKATTPIVPTKKPTVSNRPILTSTTPKPANITSKPMTTKFNRPNQSGKPPRRVTPKPSAPLAKNPSSSKIEKVTFRPVPMITTPKSLVESVERPMFVTKMKTSLFANSKPKTTAATQPVTTSAAPETSDIGPNSTDADLVEISIKSNTQPIKTNNVLKVQLKKPVDAPTKIEIEPIKVNPPVLKIEKIGDDEKIMKNNASKFGSPAILDNSQIDLKFDFNPELTKIDVETSTVVVPSSTTSKRPHKRKKNKVRRRKPTTSSPTSIATSPTTQEPTTPSSETTPTKTEDQENLDILTELGIADNSIQESKIVSDTKISPTNIKNKIKNVPKPIGTQLYNFLSREVMPSFGVMSLVGLGLGLASYFLYPFSGSIARRNYVVEPNYKYNLDEYGGNYGQNEEEVFSKVLQGMTNNDGRYGGIKDYKDNYHRYQHFDGAYTASQTTMNGDSRYPTSSSMGHRPLETTVYDTKYRNNEYKYSDTATPPNYYERRKQVFSAKHPGSSDRQFVVGNVPKEYGYAENEHSSPTTQAIQPDFETKIAQNHKFVENAPKMSTNSDDQPEAQALRTNEGYEEIEITPAAVAVEHGPRSMNSELPKRRRKRDSVIQLIPSRAEIEKEEEEIEKEEPLSNEILDIIDSVIPEDVMGGGKFAMKHNKKRDEKKSEEEKMADENEDSRQASAMTNKPIVTSTGSPVETTTQAKVDATDTTASMPASELTTTEVPSLSIDEILHAGTTSSEKDLGNSSVDSVDHSTTEKPHNEPFNIFSFVRKVAEIKFKLGIAILKHASEGFARYLGHVQKRVNGEE